MAMDRLTTWALRRHLRACGDAAEGQLVWVSAEGEMRSLGAYTQRELEGLAWAVVVAYRTTRVGSERTRLAGLRGVAQRIVIGLKS